MSGRRYILPFTVLFFAGFFLLPSYAHATVIFLTSGTSWVVPSDWNSANNTVEVIGGGGGGADSTNGGGGSGQGGGGGAYAKKTNVTLTPGATVTIAVGAAGSSGSFNSTGPTVGGDTYFCNSTSNCASITDTAVLAGAKGGGVGNPGTGDGGFGGASSGSVGDVTNSGGDGGHFVCGGSGGGGAAGAHGNGAAGGTAPFPGSCTSGANGGGGANGGSAGASAGNNPNTDDGAAGGNNFSSTGGGAAGLAGNPAGDGGAGTAGGGGGGGGNATNIANPKGGHGGVGGTGTEWDATHGSGGGGGGGGDGDVSGGPPCAGGDAGAGGLYGGGGGGGGDECLDDGSGFGGNGAQGIIVITYTPAGGGPVGRIIRLRGGVRLKGGVRLGGTSRILVSTSITFTPTDAPAAQDLGFGTDHTTFSNANIGAASSDRVVVVGVSNENFGNNTGIGSVTIAGNTATKLGEAGAASLWYATITSGTTANVVVTCISAVLNQVAIDVGTITGESSAAPNATSSYPQTITPDPQTFPSVGTSNVLTNGVAVIFAAGGNGGTPTWTNTASPSGDFTTLTSTGNTLSALLAHSYATGTQTYTLTGSVGNGYGFGGIMAVIADWAP